PRLPAGHGEEPAPPRHAPPARDGPTMTECDDTLTTLLFRGAPDADVAAHLAACPRCRAESAAVEGLARTLAAAPVPAPPLALTCAAIPIFVEHQVRLRRQESHA